MRGFYTVFGTVPLAAQVTLIPTDRLWVLQMGPPRVVAVVATPPGTAAPCCSPPRRQHGHFFCPRGRQLSEHELPSTDIVRRTRSLFEARSPVRPWTDSGSVSSGT